MKGSTGQLHTRKFTSHVWLNNYSIEAREWHVPVKQAEGPLSDPSPFLLPSLQAVWQRKRGVTTACVVVAAGTCYTLL
ncbi:hypothetical protein LWI28_014101 [Acer negundo]|uniref:Uncharacterized protein n=1 Tax=Acer negundo TaxID=4023 RepID=A0AAD5IZC3_ACENE|nr:hypothetical protein LWI28_014101 [Acer negundo]